MSNLKISQMTPAGTILGTELVPLVQDLEDDGSGLNVSATIDQLKAYVNAGSGNYLIAGGGVAYSGSGYDFNVSAATYVIQGTQYASSPDTVTINPGDSSFDRIDIIAVDTSSNVIVIEGDPSANPEAPDVDPETQLQLTFINVAAGSSAGDVTLEDMYLENTEWTYNDNTANLNPNSTVDSHGGTKSIEGTTVTTSDRFNLTRPGGLFEINNYDSFVFWIKPKAAWPNSRNLKVFWSSSGVVVGNTLTFKNGTYGFSSSTLDWQVVVIPVADFGIPVGQLVDRSSHRCAGSGATIGFFVDDVYLQGGVDPGAAGSFMRNRGDYSAIATYATQDVVVYNSQLYVCQVANSGSAPQPDNSNASWKLIATTLRVDTDGTLAADSDSRVATQKATKTAIATAQAAAVATAEAYADSLVVGLWDDRGTFDASGGAYPSSGGSGTAGAIKKGDIWTISVAGTLPTGQVVAPGDTVRALIDTPGNTQANWAIQENNIGYTPVAGPASSVSGNLSTFSGTSGKVLQDSGTPLANILNAGYVGVKGADIASAATVNLATATGDYVDVTGTVTITSFGTVAAGVFRVARFTGILTLTHNATSLILPTAANITTAAGDVITLRSLGSGNWLCVGYMRASGRALVAASTYTRGGAWTNLGSAIVAADANVIYRHVHQTGTISKWIILTAGGAGSCQIDVWKDTYANYPPTILDTIVGGNYPAISSQVKNQDTTLTSWTTSVTAGDVLAFKLNSTSVFTFISIDLEIS